jgi:hypothetical protein
LCLPQNWMPKQLGRGCKRGKRGRVSAAFFTSAQQSDSSIIANLDFLLVSQQWQKTRRVNSKKVQDGAPAAAVLPGGYDQDWSSEKSGCVGTFKRRKEMWCFLVSSCEPMPNGFSSGERKRMRRRREKVWINWESKRRRLNTRKKRREKAPKHRQHGQQGTPENGRPTSCRDLPPFSFDTLSQSAIWP